jgi:sortase A
VNGPAHEHLIRIPTNVKAGQPLGLIRIPRIGLDMVFVQGTEASQLTEGPGHYEDTAFPWASTGRVAIAGHRTTYLHPFWALNELQIGDRVVLSTKVGTYRYEVTGKASVDPGDTGILRQTAAPTLVLTTCTPRFSATQRLAVFARRI